MEKSYCPYCMSVTDAYGRCPSCGLTAGAYVPLIHHLPPGTRLHEGRYVVGRALGNGGFGITYIGRDLTLDIRVAIKEYFPDGLARRVSPTPLVVAGYLESQDGPFESNREGFLREAQTLASLEKLNTVVTARDFFEENGTAYLVMEYVDGTTLKDLAALRGGRIEPTELFGLLQPLFPALAEVHDAGLLHRDISPDNLMVEGGRLRLIDFGCSGEGSSHAMSTGFKEGYAPPEQRVGQECGPWTDVYALCATIYRCLTGTTPSGSVSRTVCDDLRPPRELGVEITEEQELALMRGLNVSIGRRLQNVRELEEALYQVEEPSSPPKPKAWLKRTVAAVVAMAYVLIALALWHPWIVDEDDVSARDPSSYEALFSDDLEAQFAEAREVRSQEDLEKADRAGEPAVIVADTQVNYGYIRVPVLIPEGVTLSGPKYDYINGEGGQLTFSQLVVNKGTLRGNIGISFDSQLVNRGNVGSEDDLYYDCRIECSGTIANSGNLYVARESYLHGDSVLYNKGYAMVSELCVQDDADLYNRGEIRICGITSRVVHTSSKPLFNDLGATFSISGDAELSEGAYICNWGELQAESGCELGASIIQNEGRIVADIGSTGWDQRLAFGHGTVEPDGYISKRLFDLSGTGENGTCVPTIDTVDGTIARASTAEELLAALESDEVSGINLTGSVKVDASLEVDKPLAIEGDAQLEMAYDTELTIRGCEVRLSGKEDALEANDVTLADGACLWGTGLTLRHDSTLRVEGSLVNLYDPLADADANDLSSSISILLDKGSVMLCSLPNAISYDVEVKGASALAIMGEADLSNESCISVRHWTQEDEIHESGILFLRGNVELLHSSIDMDDYCSWRELGGKIEASYSRIMLGGTSRFQDCGISLSLGSTLHSKTLCSIESFATSDAQISVSEDSTVTNDGDLWLKTKSAIRLDGSLVNNDDLFAVKGVLKDEDFDHITGDGDVLIV